jgi:predicted ArsR family transcriptional regulator
MDDTEQLAAICSLEDPNRRRLYGYIISQSKPVTRDEAAEALGLDRSVAAYHLDKLVGHGLLTASFARPPGRAGPGAGRPAKRYEPSDVELAATVPFRDYHLAAELLARAAKDDDSGVVRAALEVAAANFGRELTEASTSDELTDVLDEHGYGPWDDRGTLRLRNCPFHRLAQRHTELICGMNLALLAEAARAISDDREAVLDPAPGRCCVAFVPAPDRRARDAG